MPIIGSANTHLSFPLVYYQGAVGLVNPLFNKIYLDNSEAVSDVGQWTPVTFLNPADYNAKLAAVGGDIFKLLGQYYFHPVADAEGYIARYSDVLPWIVADRNAYTAAYPGHRASGPPSEQERYHLANKHYQDIGKRQGRLYAPVWPVTYTILDGEDKRRQVTGDWVDRISPSATGVISVQQAQQQQAQAVVVATGSDSGNDIIAGLNIKTLALVGIVAFFLLKGK